MERVYLSTTSRRSCLIGRKDAGCRTPIMLQTCRPKCMAANAILHDEVASWSSQSTQLHHHKSSRRGIMAASVVAMLLGGSTSASASDMTLPSALPRTDVPQAIEEGKVFLLTEEEVQALTLSERQILIFNQRIQKQNRVAEGFPSFIREGFDVKVLAPGYTVTPEGVIYKDYREGTGEIPTVGQEVTFQYTGYNESGTMIDSSYRQNRPAQIQLGMGGLIPGFDLALRTMRVGTQRRFIVPPALGPPVGPSTFFSAKQCEVFNVELLAIKTCKRQQNMMFSNVVCD